MRIYLLNGSRDYVVEAISAPAITKYGRYYRSKDTKVRASLTFSSFMMNKKWRLEEEFNNHILRFQQVNISVWALFKQGKSNSLTFQAGLVVTEKDFQDENIEEDSQPKHQTEAWHQGDNLELQQGVWFCEFWAY